MRTFLLHVTVAAIVMLSSSSASATIYIDTYIQGVYTFDAVNNYSSVFNFDLEFRPGSGADGLEIFSANQVTIMPGTTFGRPGKTNTGYIEAIGYSNVEIQGGTFGGAGFRSGEVTVQGEAFSMKIKGGTFGGAGELSGCLKLKSATEISGGTFGGSGKNSGIVEVYPFEYPGPRLRAHSEVRISGGTFAGKLLGTVNDTRPKLTANLGALGIAAPGLTALAADDPAPNDAVANIVWSGGTFEQGVVLAFEGLVPELELDLPPPGPDLQSSALAFSAPLAGLDFSSPLAALTADVPGPNLTIIGHGLYMETETTNYHNEELYPGRTFTYNAISGTLADGTVLNNVTLLVEQGVAANIVLQEAVPEPSTLALAGLGLLGLGWIAWRKKRCRI